MFRHRVGHRENLMAPPSRPENRGFRFRAIPLPLCSLPEKLRFPILARCYPALASEASRVLAQHPSQLASKPIRKTGRMSDQVVECRQRPARSQRAADSSGNGAS